MSALCKQSSAGAALSDSTSVGVGKRSPVFGSVEEKRFPGWPCCKPPAPSPALVNRALALPAVSSAELAAAEARAEAAAADAVAMACEGHAKARVDDLAGLPFWTETA